MEWIARTRRVSVRRLAASDRGWALTLLEEHWAGPSLVSRGRVHDGARLPGWVAELEGARAGLLLEEEREGELEVVLLHALVPGRGAGSALLTAARDDARRRGCRRVWLVTTNDNLAAAAFYHRCGLVQVAVHAGAVTAARQLKPGIPLLGQAGVPIRDEIEFELRLS